MQNFVLVKWITILEYFDYVGTSEHDPMIFLFVFMIKLLTNNLQLRTAQTLIVNSPNHITAQTGTTSRTKRNAKHIHVTFDAKKGRLYQIIYWS
jgi:hypothetical protein